MKAPGGANYPIFHFSLILPPPTLSKILCTPLWDTLYLYINMDNPRYLHQVVDLEVEYPAGVVVLVDVL